MVKIEAVLHPEEAEMVWAMLDDAAKQLARDPDRGRCHDSAESPEVPTSATTVAASSTACCNVGRSHDSAESPAVPTSATTAAAPSTACCDTGRSHDSAESPEAPTSATAAAASSAACAGNYQLDDAVESRQGDGESDLTGTGSSAVHGYSNSAGGEARAGGRPASVLHQQEDATKRAFNRADALVTLAQSYLRGERPDRAPIDITLTIPVDGLRGEATDPVEVGELDESFISREAVRRLSCDAGVVEVLEDEHGQVLSVGRKRRTISGALKRALCKRDKTCTFPGCTNRIYLEGHHIKHWADGGETSLINISMICSFHHRHVHEYRYTIELGPDQRPQFRDPRGRLVAAVPARSTAPDLGWPRLRAVNEPLAISAETIACEWDGSRVDHGAIVGHLVVVDGLV